jgi:hypothetical protein
VEPSTARDGRRNATIIVACGMRHATWDATLALYGQPATVTVAACNAHPEHAPRNVRCNAQHATSHVTFVVAFRRRRRRTPCNVHRLPAAVLPAALACVPPARCRVGRSGRSGRHRPGNARTMAGQPGPCRTGLPDALGVHTLRCAWAGDSGPQFRNSGAPMRPTRGSAYSRTRKTALSTSLSHRSACSCATRTGLAPATAARGLGSPLPHPHRDWAHLCHMCTGLDRTPS